MRRLALLLCLLALPGVMALPSRAQPQIQIPVPFPPQIAPQFRPQPQPQQQQQPQAQPRPQQQQPQAQQPQAQPPAQPGAGQDRIVTLTNRAAQQITKIFASPSSDTEWGNNRLSIPNLAPTRAFQLRIPGRDCEFDFQVTYADTRVEEKRKIDICRNRQLSFDATTAQLPGRERQFTVINRAPLAIKQVFVSALGGNNWGDDLLPRGEVESGDDIDLTYRGACVADIRVVFANDSAEERRKVDFCERNTAFIAPGWTTTAEMPGSADDLPRVAGGAGDAGPTQAYAAINETGTTINELYAYQAGAAQGADLLGNDTLEPDKRATVRVARGGQCRFTVKAVFNGPRDDLILENVDLCAGDEIRLTGSDPGQGQAYTAVNETGTTINELYIHRPGEARGRDLLGSDVLEVGKRVTIQLRRGEECRFQLRAVFDGPRDDLEITDLNVCGNDEIRIIGAAPNPSAAPPRAGGMRQLGAPRGATGPVPEAAVRLRNTKETPVLALFADPVGSERGVDRLGDVTLARGDGFDLALPAGGQCRFALVVLYRDGRKAESVADLCAARGREMDLP